MALVRIDHVPETVKVNLPLNVIVPDPGRIQGVPVRARKVLYLLHGLSDDASAWQRYSSIETVANAYGLVVVMPSVGRSFYLDQPNGQAYFTCLVEELPRYLSDVFGLAPRPQCSRASSRCGSCRPTPTTRAGLSSRTCSQTCRRWKAALTIPRPGCSARHDWFFRDAEIRRFLAAVPGPTPR